MSYANFSVASGIIGTIGSAVGSYQSGKLQKMNLQSQAEIAKINARISELGAQSALAQGQQQVGQLTMRAGQLKSSQRAALAANGVDLGVGNAAEVQASTDIMKEIDKNAIEANAIRTAFGYRAQSLNFTTEATMKNATAAGISPTSAAASSLLEGAGKVAGNWYTLSKLGAFNSPSNGDIGDANKSEDPIYTLGSRRSWW